MIQGNIGREGLTAMGSMLSEARAAGIETLQISANFANDRLAPIIQAQVAKYGGT